MSTRDPNTQSSRRAGGLMLVLAWAMVLGLVALAFNGWLQGRTNEVTLVPTNGGHYLATGRINGEAVDFLVDTGATAIALPESLAQRLGLSSLGQVTLNTANGVTTGWATRLDSVTLGGITLNDVGAVATRGLEDGQVLLGMTFLDRLDWRRTNGVLRLSMRER